MWKFRPIFFRASCRFWYLDLLLAAGGGGGCCCCCCCCCSCCCYCSCCYYFSCSCSYYSCCCSCMLLWLFYSWLFVQAHTDLHGQHEINQNWTGTKHSGGSTCTIPVPVPLSWMENIIILNHHQPPVHIPLWPLGITVSVATYHVPVAPSKLEIHFDGGPTSQRTVLGQGDAWHEVSTRSSFGCVWICIDWSKRWGSQLFLVTCPLERFLPFPCNRCANGERHLKFNDMISK